VSTARRRIGSIVALLVLAAIVALAWYLTHRPAPTSGPGGPAATARGGGGRGPGAAARGAPPSTVGVANPKHPDFPV
jgi:multidrug efflux system membrane fusion protein